MSSTFNEYVICEKFYSFQESYITWRQAESKCSYLYFAGKSRALFRVAWKAYSNRKNISNPLCLSNWNEVVFISLPPLLLYARKKFFSLPNCFQVQFTMEGYQRSLMPPPQFQEELKNYHGLCLNITGPRLQKLYLSL